MAKAFSKVMRRTKLRRLIESSLLLSQRVGGPKAINSMRMADIVAGLLNKAGDVECLPRHDEAQVVGFAPVDFVLLLAAVVLAILSDAVET